MAMGAAVAEESMAAKFRAESEEMKKHQSLLAAQAAAAQAEAPQYGFGFGSEFPQGFWLPGGPADALLQPGVLPASGVKEALAAGFSAAEIKKMQDLINEKPPRTGDPGGDHHDVAAGKGVLELILGRHLPPRRNSDVRGGIAASGSAESPTPS